MNAQLAGMALGAVFLGDIRGQKRRRAILLCSILVHSIANLATAGVQDVWQYGLARFLAVSVSVAN